MIIVLFGPPGVGKTYIGGVLESKLSMHFFDADVLFDDEYRRSIRSGNYSDDMRDKFFEKLSSTVENILTKLKNDEVLVVAQAFAKDKNRIDFLHRFDNQVKFVLVHAPKTLAHNRVMDRIKNLDHIIDENAFEYVWSLFELPSVQHDDFVNDELHDDRIISKFSKYKECKTL
ncbi:AAA family ATPase [Candidatus Woesebacteria bacterium]|nr:AAA family ATPase [Candidatus Woesebacteria bacterium]